MIRFPELQLDFIESRVLGSMLEKETTTPDYYPLTFKAVEAACNQSSNRFPVTRFSGEEVDQAIQRLRRKDLIMQVHLSGSRVPKYEHQLPEVLDLSSAEKAVLTVLLLRGIQTAGELKQRSERMHPFETVSQVEEILRGFMDYPYGPLVRELPIGGGRRVKTYGHLLGGESGFSQNIIHSGASPDGQTEEVESPDLESRVRALEEQVARLNKLLEVTEEKES